ncbi:ATP-binding protein [Streptomyces millisiae]|uniref:ATP-binding protein n=1 Tax=Streptomyces millisiae TaxID=3075542 RepID=A0ABU2LNA5_9ACTN|nr:ATP-binding protein [Streptomyces sp. DSM 44918]MDT0318553.1 ATP-binding protein [Streptomyces sp. DSM 44918]
MSADERHVFHVLSVPEHVPLARREAAKVLADWGIGEDLLFAASLIVTELVGNVVRHAAVLSPTATVTLAADAEALSLAVADAHPFRPAPLLAAHAEGGRGLAVVAALAAEAGGSHEVVADEDSGGKRIVVRLPLAPATERAAC